MLQVRTTSSWVSSIAAVANAHFSASSASLEPSWPTTMGPAAAIDGLSSDDVSSVDVLSDGWTTITTHDECAAHCELTEPNISPTKPPWPRLPTTSTSAERLSSRRIRAAEPSRAVNSYQSGSGSPRTSRDTRPSSCSAFSPGDHDRGSAASPIGMSHVETARRRPFSFCVYSLANSRAASEGFDPSTPTMMSGFVRLLVSMCSACLAHRTSARAQGPPYRPARAACRTAPRWKECRHGNDGMKTTGHRGGTIDVIFRGLFFSRDDSGKERRTKNGTRPSRFVAGGLAGRTHRNTCSSMNWPCGRSRKSSSASVS